MSDGFCQDITSWTRRGLLTQVRGGSRKPHGALTLGFGGRHVQVAGEVESSVERFRKETLGLPVPLGRTVDLPDAELSGRDGRIGKAPRSNRQRSTRHGGRYCCPGGRRSGRFGSSPREEPTPNDQTAPDSDTVASPQQQLPASTPMEYWRLAPSSIRREDVRQSLTTSKGPSKPPLMLWRCRRTESRRRCEGTFWADHLLARAGHHRLGQRRLTTRSCHTVGTHSLGTRRDP